MYPTITPLQIAQNTYDVFASIQNAHYDQSICGIGENLTTEKTDENFISFLALKTILRLMPESEKYSIQCFFKVPSCWTDSFEHLELLTRLNAVVSKLRQTYIKSEELLICNPCWSHTTRSLRTLRAEKSTHLMRLPEGIFMMITTMSGIGVSTDLDKLSKRAEQIVELTHTLNSQISTLKTKIKEAATPLILAINESKDYNRRTRNQSEWNFDDLRLKNAEEQILIDQFKAVKFERKAIELISQNMLPALALEQICTLFSLDKLPLIKKTIRTDLVYDDDAENLFKVIYEAARNEFVTNVYDFNALYSFNISYLIGSSININIPCRRTFKQVYIFKVKNETQSFELGIIVREKDQYVFQSKIDVFYPKTNLNGKYENNPLPFAKKEELEGIYGLLKS